MPRGRVDTGAARGENGSDSVTSRWRGAARGLGGTDGHAKGARGCATTTALPPNHPLPLRPPANSAAARRSARSTGSNATTAYNTSPSRSPAVYLAAATLLRSPPRALAVSRSRLFLSLSLSLPRAHHHPPPTLAHPSTTVIYMRTHSGVAARLPLPLPPSLFRSCSLSRSISPSVIAADCGARGNASAERFAAAEATRAVTLFRAAVSRRGGARRRDARCQPRRSGARIFLAQPPGRR